MAIKIRYATNVLLAVTLLPACIMMFLPQQPTTAWQNTLFEFITQKLHIQTGMFGELALYTVFVTAYFSLLSSLWAVFIFWMLLVDKRSEIPKPSQFRIWDALMMMGLIIGFTVFSFSMMLWHFSKQDMTVALGRNGYLFQTLYQYKLGIIFGELFFMLFLIFSQLVIFMVVYAGYNFIKKNVNK